MKKKLIFILLGVVLILFVILLFVIHPKEKYSIQQIRDTFMALDNVADMANDRPISSKIENNTFIFTFGAVEYPFQLRGNKLSITTTNQETDAVLIMICMAETISELNGNEKDYVLNQLNVGNIDYSLLNDVATVHETDNNISITFDTNKKVKF